MVRERQLAVDFNHACLLQFLDNFEKGILFPGGQSADKKVDIFGGSKQAEANIGETQFFHASPPWTGCNCLCKWAQVSHRQKSTTALSQ